MILTYKIKHNEDFNEELEKAFKIAKFAVKTKSKSSKDVKHFGLKAMLSNQILKKYSKNTKCKSVKSVKLTIPNQGIKVDQEKQKIRIPCLKLKFKYQFPNHFTKINQIEIDNKFYYVSCQFREENKIKINKYIGIDLNTTSHCAVAANPSNGKVIKMGKSAHHIHTKYKNTRKKLQAKGAKQQLKTIRNKESNKVKDINHKISRKIVETAKKEKCGIKLEDLKGIRKNKKHNKNFKYSLNSWCFYQLKQMIEYKARLLGVSVVYVDPRYTSQRCSRCGLIGNRNGKGFKCDSCGHVDHADSNAAFNIASSESLKTTSSNDQLVQDRDCIKRSTDTLERETHRKVPCEPDDT